MILTQEKVKGHWRVLKKVVKLWQYWHLQLHQLYLSCWLLMEICCRNWDLTWRVERWRQCWILRVLFHFLRQWKHFHIWRLTELLGKWLYIPFHNMHACMYFLFQCLCCDKSLRDINGCYLCCKLITTLWNFLHVVFCFVK